ncbi:MAG TPA: hypothetical protein VMW19_10320 [Myxococcota bacterium]|nr:hypothetical protein [Myxococcota bacterium]
MSRARWIIALLLTTGFAGGIGFAVGERQGRVAPAHTRKAAATLAPNGSVAAAVQAALLDPDRLAGVEALAALLRKSGPDQLAEIRAGFETVFLDVADIEVVLLAEWWADFDPKAAFTWSQNSAIGHHPLVMHSVLEAWARRDPLAARDAYAGLVDPFLKRGSIDSLMSGWDASGQPGLIEYVRSLGASVDALMSMSPIARRHVLRDGPEGAFAWAEAFPEDPPEDALRFKLQLFRRVVSAAAPIDPEKTAAFAARHANGPNGDGLLTRAAKGWVSQFGDGEKAMRWLSTQPDGKQRDDAVQEAYVAWSFGWRDQATAWLLAAPHELWLEPALLVHAARLAITDPEAALAVARGLQNPELREITFASIGDTWLRRDPEAARRWLASGEPSENVRNQILQRAGEGQQASQAADARAPAAP